MTTAIHTSLPALRKALAAASVLVFDFETSGLSPHDDFPVGLGVHLPGAEKTYYVNVGHSMRDPKFPRYTTADLAEALRPFFSDPDRHAIAHNATFDLRWLYKIGVDVRCRVSCTLTHSHRVNENLRPYGDSPTHHASVDVSYGLKELTTLYFHEKPPTLEDVIGGTNTCFAPPHEVAQYCRLDVLNTWALYERAADAFASDHRLDKLVAQIDDPNVLVVAEMMWRGVPIDRDELYRQKAEYRTAIQNCRDAIWQILTHRPPLDTPTKLRSVLRGLKFSKDLENDPFWDDLEDDFGWQPSVATEVLIDVFNQVEDKDKRTVLACIISMRQMKQRVDAFLNPLLDKLKYSGSFGRLYFNRFSSTLVTTRFSCTPNLMALPKRADAVSVDDLWQDPQYLPVTCLSSAKTRNAFRAPDDHTFVEFDLGAAEPRYLAMAFQRALEHREFPLLAEKAKLQSQRYDRWPHLMKLMHETQKFEDTDYEPETVRWPKCHDDPLWEVFKHGRFGGDPYSALLAAICPKQYQQAKASGTVKAWLKRERWRGKRAWLALAYGSGPATLAPQLGWTEDQTRKAIDRLNVEFPTLPALKHLNELQVRHLGEVRSLFGRPRRINGIWELCRPDPCVVAFQYSRPIKLYYVAHIIPLGTFKHGIQCFVEDCYYTDAQGNPGRSVLRADRSNGEMTHADWADRFVSNRYFNQPPFRNIPYSILSWVKDWDSYEQSGTGLIHHIPKLQRAYRQAFNFVAQATGADHLRWLANNMDRELCQRSYRDCELVLTIHDSLIYQVPKRSVNSFIPAALKVLRRRPDWCTFDIKVDVEVGEKFGELQEWR